MEVNLHRQVTVHGNEMQHNQSAEVYGQRSSQGAQDRANTGGGSSGGNGGNAKEDLPPILADMISLFQQFLASMGNKNKNGNFQLPEAYVEKNEQAEGGEKTRVQLEGQGKEIAESSAQSAARGLALNSGPYCYRCLKRGHPKEDCSMTLICEICESTTHVKDQCALLKKAKSTNALTCGYVVDGLGFYYIPNSVAVRPKAMAKTAMVRVVQGEMTAVQVKAEMERLVPAKMVWAVEEIDQNRFKTVFPSKGEMKRIVEWGVVHTKDRKAAMVIEELEGGGNVKQVMRKVWVQMIRMPSELRDFLTIWVVGTIVGVTKDVDVIFTRQYNRARLQVLVLDPALIPTSVDVVIGDNVYELHFKVEPDEMRDNPGMLDMEDDNSDFDAMDEADDCKDVHEDFIQEDNGSKSKGKSVDLMPKKSHTEQQGRGKKFMSQKSIQNAPGVDEMMLVEDSEDEAMGELSNDEQTDGDY
jgi:hypothetical protein